MNNISELYKQIQPYIENGLISEQSHPMDENVKIFNYTQKCQFEKAWDEVTENCRGLIINVETAEVIARPFPKFFNYQEHIANGKDIPDETPIINEKLDGSLGILYSLGGKDYIATRGSFTSEQAVWATKWWRENMPQQELSQGVFTHLFEIIYPENRIVVNYYFSGMVHLASINKKTGDTVTDPTWDVLYWDDKPVRKTKRIDAQDLDQLLKMDKENEEGFVLFYPKANLRLKIKFPEYVRLHKLITGVSEIAIWEHMRDGKSLDDLLEKVPDEFFNWVRSIQERLKYEYSQIEDQCLNDYHRITLADIPREDRKSLALEIQKTKHPGILFSMLDDKDYSQAIYKMIRPKGQSQFKTDIDL